MNMIFMLRELPLAVCAWAAAAHAESSNPAYDPTYDSTTYDSRYQPTDGVTPPLRYAPRVYVADSTYQGYGISDELRQTDLRLGDCLKANGGRMVGRCADLLQQSYRIAGELRSRQYAGQ